jgi:hypothetical protein
MQDNDIPDTEIRDWYNTNNVNASQLQSAGVTQPDIDWMAQNGYLGATQQTPPQAQPMQSAGGMGGGNLFNTPNEITGLLSNIGYSEIPEEKQLPDTANPTDNLINRLGYGV